MNKLPVAFELSSSLEVRGKIEIPDLSVLGIKIVKIGYK